ncbi:unnamed protein product [Diabrotica balteata]|uniref:Multidrug resistance-associated protein lethal(2)03659 n=1 Tax=Diabrotica balteata TaxID=107213 RepID=A0A9N9SNN0_DIABA|nr:unnamed protein product [Diabrotica balteata]
MDTGDKIRRQRNPRETANIFSLLSFAYTGSLFRQALKNDLEESNVYDVLKNLKSKTSGDLLEEQWAEESKRARPSMARLMWKRWGWKYIFIGCIDLTWRTFRSIMEPSAVSNLISYFKPGQTKVTKNDAYYYAALVLFLHVTNCIYLHNYIMWVQGLAIEIKAAFSSLIYRKALKLSPAALADISLGNIVTLITKDVYTFRLSIWIINEIWTGVVQVIVVCYLLYSKIGLVSFAGIGILILAIPIQVYLGKIVTDLKLKTGEKTDERLQVTQEALNSIRIIKMYTWEEYFNTKINVTRCKELSKLLLVFYFKMLIILTGLIFSKAGFYVLLTAYIWLGYSSDTTLIFYILSNFKDLKQTLGNVIPNRMGKAGEFISSFKRISKVMNSEEINIKPQKSEPTGSPYVEMDKVSVSIRDKEILKSVSFKVNSGLTLVTGKVGSGKSSLLKVLVQDYPITSGDFVTKGRISYASQDPWLFPSTIKQNIIFGQQYNEKRYQEVIRVCALQYDFSLFEKGDETVLSDRGSNLSKGQQARINLARAVYKQSEIYLLDDALTALDQSVQDYIFNECILKYLKDKIVFLVCQKDSHIQHADNVILIKDGELKEFGKPNDFIIKEVGYIITTDDDIEKDCVKTENDNQVNEYHKLLEEDKVEAARPVYSEIQKKGSVSVNVYGKYFIYGGGFALAFFNLMMGGLTQYSESYSDKLLTRWVDNQQDVLILQSNISWHVPPNSQSMNNASSYLDIAREKEQHTFRSYTIMIVVSAILDLAKTYLMFDFCRRASVNLHNTIVKKILNAVMLFFDRNYIGNILNRFSQDLVNIDEQLPQTLSECYRFVFSVGGIIILIASIDRTFLLYSAIIFTLLLILRYLYLPAGRSLKRLDASTRSPMIGHLNASLEGLTTVRAYGVQKRLIDEFDKHQDLHTSAHYMSACTIRAFGFLMDFLCSTFMIIVITRFIFVDTDTSAGNVGLALTQVMLLGNSVQWGVREWSELENLMTSVERALEYTEIKTEAKSGSTLEHWPSKGTVTYEKVSLSYTENVRVLKDLNFSVNSQEKIGIVGRTGAGKSSIISTLFRLYDIDGKILIDGVNIKLLDLTFLRKKLALIPQDPILFTGTIRTNLDPLNEYKDTELWEALEKANIKHWVTNLSQPISKGSLDISSGQKQLICLARAILRQSKVVFLDEATANMDHETDELLHRTVKSNFVESTMFIIAHRLHSVLDCDRVMVMDKGQIKEFDSPRVLLQNTNGAFYSMVKHAGLLNYLSYS